MLYPELFKSLEAVRWHMDKDIPWDTFDASMLTDDQAKTIRMTRSRNGPPCPRPRCSCATTATILIFRRS